MVWSLWASSIFYIGAARDILYIVWDSEMDFDVTDQVLFILHLYFVIMSYTVERYYCHGPLSSTDTRFLVKETIDFCTQHNRLFLARPEWMVAGK